MLRIFYIDHMGAKLEQLNSHIEEHLEANLKGAKMTNVKDLFSLEGQTALVTGGTRGIGQAMAIALAEAGADILLVQVDTHGALSIPSRLS